MAISHVDVPVGTIWYPAEQRWPSLPRFGWLHMGQRRTKRPPHAASWGKAQKALGLSQASIMCAHAQAMTKKNIFFIIGAVNAPRPRPSLRPGHYNRYVFDITRARHARTRADRCLRLPILVNVQRAGGLASVILITPNLGPICCSAALQPPTPHSF